MNLYNDIDALVSLCKCLCGQFKDKNHSGFSAA
jgi:hypothetical protein